MNILKIFVIGFNKTGTTSIYKLLKMLKYNVTHSTIPVLDIIDKYDAFTDGVHTNFKEYYKKYPNSLFILNTRPLKNWLISRYKHGKMRNFRKSRCWPVDDSKTLKWINERYNHHLNVLQFFKDKPKQLLVVNIEENNWENKIYEFIKQKKIYQNLKIHSNKRPDRFIDKNKMQLILNSVNKCLKECNLNGTELL